MNHSISYKVFVYLFLLLFSFLHVGYATVEYICSMGMQMDTTVCPSCYPDYEPTENRIALISSSGISCCERVVNKTETIDNYISNNYKLSIINTYHVSPVGIVVNPEENQIPPCRENDDPLIPHYTLHGISTSFQYTSSLR